MTQQEFINGLSRLAPRHRGCVATIGSFDGVHRGHQAVLTQVIATARKLGVPSLAMVFEPQPYEYFAPEQAPARIMRLREKVSALFVEGIDRVLCLKFDQVLRSLSAQAFVEKVLVQSLAVQHLVIGDDFRFGCDRKGDFNYLQKSAQQLGFSVSDTCTQLVGEERISSTRIRALLAEDKLAAAAGLLGRDYAISGRVIYGKQLGRTLGFPTCNLGLGRYSPPVHGVYAVKASSDQFETAVHGVANVGLRPTVSGGKRPLLEVHLLDFQADLYGKCLSVGFSQKLRNERRFDSLSALQQQIRQDIETARNYFDET